MYLDILRELLEISSETGHEKAIVDHIQGKYLPKSERIGNNLVYLEEGSEPYLLLVGHSDTVKIDDHQVVKTTEDAIYARGSVDMKSGVAFMLNEMQRKRPYRRGIIVYDREEGPLPNGLTDILNQRNFSKAKLGILFEPTSSRVEFGCRGSLHIHGIIRGKAAHSARPYLGENAIYRLNQLINFLNGLCLADHSYEGVTYQEHLSATQIGSHGSRNSLPEYVWVNLNFRFSPTRTPEEAADFIYSILTPYVDDILFQDNAAGALPLGRNHPVRAWAQKKKVISLKDAWTDVAQLSYAGIAAFNFGIGNPHLCHVVDEHLKFSEIDRFHEVYEALSEVMARDVF